MLLAVVAVGVAWLSIASPQSVDRLEAGRALFKSGDVAAALKAFDDAAKTSPQNATAHYYRGLSLEALRKPTEAEAAYRRAVSIDSKFVEAQNNLGGLLLAQGKTDAAAAAFRAAIAAKPRNARAHFNLGVCLERQNKHSEALESYQTALKLDPSDGQSALNLGVAQRRAGRNEQALATLKLATGLSPKEPQAFTNYGLALSDAGKLEEAQAILQKATQLGPTFSPAWQSLGRVEFRLKHHDKAFAAFTKASNIDPRSAGIAADRCQARAAKSPDAEAATICQAAIALDNAAPLPRYVLLKLRAAAGDCVGAKQVLLAFVKLPAVSARAKQGAQGVVDACVPAQRATSRK